MNNNSLQDTNRIAKNTLYLYIRMFFTLAVTLYTSRVVLAMLGEVDYGIYGVVGGFVSMFGFLNTSMNNAIQRFYNYEWGKNGEESVAKVYSHALIIQILIAILLLIVLESVGVWYINHVMVIPPDRLATANWVFQFSILSILFVIVNVPFAAAIMAYERMDFYAIIGLVEVSLKLLLAILLQFTPFDKLTFWAILAPLTSGLTFLCYYVYTKRQLLHVRFKRSYESSLLKEMLSFAGWNLFGSISGVMKEHGINLVLNFFFGPIVNAARALSSQVSGAVMQFTSNVSIAVRPQLTKSYAAGNVDKAIKFMYTISKVNFLSFVLFALPLSLETKFVLDIWLESYPKHTISFIVLVFLTCSVNLLNSPISMVVHASAQMRNYQVISSCISMAAVPAAFLGHYLFDLAPEISLLSIFLFTAAAQVASLLILKNIVRTFSVVDYARKVILPITISFVLASLLPAALAYSMPEGWLRFLAVGTASVVCVLGFSYLGGLDKSEKELVNSLVIKVIKRL